MMYIIRADNNFTIGFEQIIQEANEYSPTYAKQLGEELENILTVLVNQPKMYPVHSSIPKYRKFLLKKKYIVFYVVDETKHIIRLVRIYHAVRDLTGLLD